MVVEKIDMEGYERLSRDMSKNNSISGFQNWYFAGDEGVWDVTSTRRQILSFMLDLLS